MTRLEKKCLIASASAHSALALLLVLGPLLWMTRPKQVILPVLTFIPSRLVDGAMSAGGGSPEAKTAPAEVSPPAAPPVVVTPPRTVPVKPEPAPAKPEPKPAKEVEKPAPPKPRNFVPAKTKPKVEISQKRDTATPVKPADTRAQTEANARAAQAKHVARVNSILGAIQKGVSSSTGIEVPGPGGEAYADYGQWVLDVYKRAWTPPVDLADDLATVTVEVVILRNGGVHSFKITKRSGHPGLDSTVDRLRSIKYIAAFPDGARDERRTFIIDFNLRSKR